MNVLNPESPEDFKQLARRYEAIADKSDRINIARGILLVGKIIRMKADTGSRMGPERLTELSNLIKELAESIYHGGPEDEGK